MAKHIHFIGICGVAMSALAIAFKKAGWGVTGSDKGFYPPVSDNLKQAGVAFYPGWHPDKMGIPDLVVVGNVAGSENPEWLYVQEKKIPYSSYPEVIREYLIKKNSIVCAGTFGKSTNATLMSWILKCAGWDPSYMFGGISQNGMDPALMTESEWSVVEGDEYKTSRWDTGAKFFHYAPTHLLLTAAVWDHADVYPTPESYREAFKKLIDLVPDSGVVVASADEPTVRELLEITGRKAIWYGGTNDATYKYSNVVMTRNSISFDINHNGETYHVTTSVLGSFTTKNFTGCFALSHTIGIAPEIILEAIRSFRGVKRRLEKRLDGNGTVFDDIAHSPNKAVAVLESIRKAYAGNIYAVFEPNTGWRKRETRDGYAHAFDSADMVIIPRLTHIKYGASDSPMDGQELADTIAQTHPHVEHIDDDKTLVNFLVSRVKKNDVVIFLGSHGFRGMIEDLVARLS